MAPSISVPFFKPTITDAEIDEVVDCLKSGWLTTGPRAKRFEEEFATAVGAKYAVAVNSCTAALHLAVEAIGLKAGQGVIVPTMTFAATAEIIQYCGAVPILVDCDPETFNMDLNDAADKIEVYGKDLEIVGMIPVHISGQMMDCHKLSEFAIQRGLWVIEDAAHAFPSAYRTTETEPWIHCGADTARVTCFSFYANKTITTGEGGMALTSNKELADRMRQMSLHGLSHDAWKRYEGGSVWDYRIVAPGYKYNLTDVAASIGLHQLHRAEEMRCQRESIADYYDECFRDIPQIRLPSRLPNRIHSWHLYPIRLQLDLLSISRDEFMERLRERGVGCSVHWRPLHLHIFYESKWRPEDLPVATDVWKTLISLPFYPAMSSDEKQHVIRVVRELCVQFSNQPERANVITPDAEVKAS